MDKQIDVFSSFCHTKMKENIHNVWKWYYWPFLRTWEFPKGSHGLSWVIQHHALRVQWEQETGFHWRIRLLIVNQCTLFCFYRYPYQHWHFQTQVSHCIARGMEERVFTNPSYGVFYLSHSHRLLAKLHLEFACSLGLNWSLDMLLSTVTSPWLSPLDLISASHCGIWPRFVLKTSKCTMFTNYLLMNPCPTWNCHFHGTTYFSFQSREKHSFELIYSDMSVTDGEFLILSDRLPGYR